MNSVLQVYPMNNKTGRYVGEIMTRNVVSVSKDADLTEAIRIMEREGLSAIPVVNAGGQVCGIVSNSDLISLTYDLQCDISVLPYVGKAVRESLIDALNEDNQMVQVTRVMTEHVESVTPQDEISTAARVMTEQSIHHLPVVNQEHKPIGIVSASDIVRTVAFKPDGLTQEMHQ